MKGQMISNIGIIIFIIMIVIDRFIIKVPNLYYNLTMILVIIMLIIGIFKNRKCNIKK